MPPTAVMSAAVKSTGASLKVKVTTELLSPSLSAASTMSTVTVGFSGVDGDGVGAAGAGVAGRVGVAAGVTDTEPVPEKPSVAVKVAV